MHIFLIRSNRTGDDASLSAGLPVTAFLRSGAQVNGMDFTSETADGSIPSSTLKLASAMTAYISNQDIHLAWMVSGFIAMAWVEAKRFGFNFPGEIGSN
jgi:hypothetical protein